MLGGSWKFSITFKEPGAEFKELVNTKATFQPEINKNSLRILQETMGTDGEGKDFLSRLENDLKVRTPPTRARVRGRARSNIGAQHARCKESHSLGSRLRTADETSLSWPRNASSAPQDNPRARQLAPFPESHTPRLISLSVFEALSSSASGAEGVSHRCARPS